MLANIKFVGSRINCYLFGVPWLGFSIPVRGWVHPNSVDSKLWHFPIPILVMETKYHFEVKDSDKLLSFSLQPFRDNTIEVFRWLKTLDQSRVNIREPFNTTNYIFPKTFFGKQYSGEIYPEDKYLPPALSDYRDRVEVISRIHSKKILQ